MFEVGKHYKSIGTQLVIEVLNNRTLVFGGGIEVRVCDSRGNGIYFKVDNGNEFKVPVNQFGAMFKEVNNNE